MSFWCNGAENSIWSRMGGKKERKKNKITKNGGVIKSEENRRMKERTTDDGGKTQSLRQVERYSLSIRSSFAEHDSSGPSLSGQPIFWIGQQETSFRRTFGQHGTVFDWIVGREARERKKSKKSENEFQC